MCFNAQVSAKKKNSEQRLVDRTITQNLLSDQLEVLKNEERRSEPKKRLFDDGPSDAKKRRKSTEKENQQTRRGIRFEDEVIQTTEVSLEEPTNASKPTPAELAATRSPVADTMKAGDLPETKEEDSSSILEHLNTMLEECLTLYDAGCPLENLLPWLEEIEAHVPRAVTFAPYYVCKAKVLSAFPQQVLDVYCQAVLNDAQPRELLAAEMKTSLSVLLVPPPPELPPVSCGSRMVVTVGGCTPSPAAPNNISWTWSPDPAGHPSTGAQSYTSLRGPPSPGAQTNTPLFRCSNRRSGNNNSSSCCSSRLVDTTPSLPYLSETGSCLESPSVGAASGRESIFSTLSAASSVSGAGVSSSSFTSASRCSTPLSQQGSFHSRGPLSGNDVGSVDPQGLRFCSAPQSSSSATAPATRRMGSTVKYSISSTTPLLRQVKDPSPIAVVTPVRRSTRLSGRQLTPGVVLRREVTSVSDLSDTERQTMLFQVNPAITGQ